MKPHLVTLALSASVALPMGGVANAQSRHIVVQSTTSTQNSGLYDEILPKFVEETGLEVRVVAVGTGQAIKNAMNCDGDVLLVHSKAAEEKFVAEGHGVSRSDLMYNDFVLVGPPTGPENVKGDDIITAMTAIAGATTPFVSRGDDSGTHKEELALWKEANIDVAKDSGTWYREAGSGMGATLNTAVGMKAYTLSDRATWISFGNKGDFTIAVEGDPRLANQYGIIAVSPEKCSNVKADDAKLFIDWMLGEKGQAAIAAFKLEGEQLFFPNAEPVANSGNDGDAASDPVETEEKTAN